jgi:hypothetical protein
VRTARAAAPLLGLALALGGCAADGGPAEPAVSSGTGALSTQDPADPALAAACATFWGDPDYAEPLSRQVLDRAGSAPEVGPSDPDFFALTGDDVETAFEGAPQDAREGALTLADWFRTQPERGADADLPAFAAAWAQVATSCRDTSAAALWASGGGEAGAKPAALVCADVFDTPATLTHFANSNVLTSNMFKLVGLSPREVPAGRTDELRATAELLEAQAVAVDDDAVRAALEEIRAPFTDALDGDTSSDGLQGPLDRLATACADRGYHAPVPAEEDEGAVVGASAPSSAPGRTAPSAPGRTASTPRALPNGVPA